MKNDQMHITTFVPLGFSDRSKQKKICFYIMNSLMYVQHTQNDFSLTFLLRYSQLSLMLFSKKKNVRVIHSYLNAFLFHHTGLIIKTVKCIKYALQDENKKWEMIIKIQIGSFSLHLSNRNRFLASECTTV